MNNTSSVKLISTKIIFIINILLIIIASLSIIIFAAHNRSVGMLADDGMYLLMADWFSSAFASPVRTFPQIWQNTQFPPFFPLLLAVFSANSLNLLWAHAFVASFTVLAIIPLYLWMKSEQTIAKSWIVLLLVFWLLLPKSLLASTEVLSEPLYIFLSYSTLYLLSLAKATNRQKIFYLTAVLIAITVLTRSIGICLFIPALIYLWREEKNYKIILVSLLPLVLWYAFSFIFLRTSEIYLSVPWSYIKARTWAGNFEVLLNYWHETFWPAWVNSLSFSYSIISQIIAFILLIAVIWRLFQRLRLGKIDAQYILLYLLLIWVWPFPVHVHRFLWPILVILLFYAFETLYILFIKYYKNPIPAYQIILFYLIFLIALVPNWLRLWEKFTYALPEKYSQYRGSRLVLTAQNNHAAAINIDIHLAAINAIEQAVEAVPENQCLFVTSTELVMYYGKRAALLYPPPYFPENLKEQWAKRCNYVYIMHEHTSANWLPNYHQHILLNRQLIADFTYQINGEDLPLASLYRLQH